MENLVWTPLALPAVKLVEKHFRTGAVVVMDNTKSARSGYADLLAYFADPGNGYQYTELPFRGGLGMAVRLTEKNQ
jgi:hypothetical protein